MTKLKSGYNRIEIPLRRDGVYFYQLIMNDYTDTKKMVLIK
jgi:hypothetical protein